MARSITRACCALDLRSVAPSLAGPKRPQDRIEIGKVKSTFTSSFSQTARRERLQPAGGATGHTVEDGQRLEIASGDVLIAAITSCTNTSNPSVLLAAGLLAKKAVEAGLHGQATGQDFAGARIARRHGVPDSAPACCPTWKSSASMSPPTAARPASAMPAICVPRSTRPSRRTTSFAPPCYRATATSRPASIRTSRPTSWPRRRWSSPTPSPAPCCAT